jgi:8-oxo-dGTP pyrophosphatase MutT (NUDIX family)
MYRNSLIDQIQTELASNLPGKRAHHKFTPPHRLSAPEFNQLSEHTKESAVAVILYFSNNEATCLLLQRSEYPGNHSGQICFPGGKREETDENIEITARRECLEETGVCLEQGNLLGKLTEVYIPVSQFMVHPFVYYLENEPVFLPNPREVAEIVTFPLLQLVNDEWISTTDITLQNGTIYQNVPYFSISEKIVWGATALLLGELREVLLAITKKEIMGS